jgi:hypothetical protein
MQTLAEVFQTRFAEGDTWSKEALSGIRSQVSLDTLVCDLAVGSVRLATESPQSAVPTVLILTPDRLVFGQTSTGVGALRWLPLQSVVNLDAIDSASGTTLYYEISLTGGIAMAMQCPEDFVAAFVDTLTTGPRSTMEATSLDAVLPPILDDASSLDRIGPPALTEGEVPPLRSRSFDPFKGLGPDTEVHQDDPMDLTAETPIVTALPRIEDPRLGDPRLGDPLGGGFVNPEVATPEVANPEVANPEVASGGLPMRTPGAAYAGSPQTAPIAPLPGGHGGPVDRDAHADLSAPMSPPFGQPAIRGAQLASGETPVVQADGLVDDRWMDDILDESDPGGTPSWVNQEVSNWERWPEGTPNVAVPAGYTSEEINFGVDDFADLAGEFDEKNDLSELEDMPPAPAGMTLMHAVDANWWSDLTDWPEAFRSVTYLGGHPKHAKRKKNVTLHFTPMGLGVTTGGLKNWAMEIPWNRVRSIDIEGSDELMFRSSLRIDLSSSALVIDTDEGTVFFECRLRRPASVRASLAPMLNAMTGN